MSLCMRRWGATAGVLLIGLAACSTKSPQRERLGSSTTAQAGGASMEPSLEPAALDAGSAAGGRGGAGESPASDAAARASDGEARMTHADDDAAVAATDAARSPDAALGPDAAPSPDAALGPDAAPSPDAALGPDARLTVRELASPPDYFGTTDNAAGCTTRYATLGFEPVDAAAALHPLFLYFVGTAFSADDASARHDSLAARTVTEAMARRGFVALSVQYDNGALAWLSDHKNQLACLFGADQSRSLLASACGLPQVDCNAGIATWGHSQGAFVAVASASYDPRIRAAWATGYGGDASTTLPKNRLRVVNAEADTSNGTVAVLNQIDGFTASECPDDGRSSCLRADGSGWIIVRHSDCVTSSADHCWFDRRSCFDSNITLEPSWIDPTSNKAFALEPNADWVAETARRP